MPSKAFDTLLAQRLGEIRAFVSLRPASREEVEYARAVNRAATILLCAHLEGFIEDLIGEVVDYLNDCQPPATRLPPILRAAHVEVEIKRISEMTDVGKRAERVELLFLDHAFLWDQEGQELGGRLSSEVVLREISNPGAPEIERVLRRIGIDDVFVDVELPDEADVEKRINELVGVRNSIAHGGADTNVTDDQVERYVQVVEYFGRALDASAASTVQRICDSPELPWA